MILVFCYHHGFRYGELRFLVKSSFELTVESNYMISTLSDCLKYIAPVFQSMRSKTDRTSKVVFFPRFQQITGNCQEYTFVACRFCFPTTDLVTLSRGVFKVGHFHALTQSF